MSTFGGALTIEASFEVATGSRVSVQFLRSTLRPDALQKLFEQARALGCGAASCHCASSDEPPPTLQNYELLLSIFNPDGWLDITYVDNELRVGRDDKGNIFLLERM